MFPDLRNKFGEYNIIHANKNSGLNYRNNQIIIISY